MRAAYKRNHLPIHKEGNQGYGWSPEYLGPIPRKLISPNYAPMQRALCICSGCSPFAIDDGIRTKSVHFSNDSSAFVGVERKRRTIVTKLVEAERAKEAVMAKRVCGQCGSTGHDARFHKKKQDEAQAAKNGSNPITKAIDEKIAALKHKIAGLEAAKAALAD